ncbi:hypothetical protein JAAARDRAFT_49294 [Jaapia argillacea MUCL 33604]|uniref:Uncharacterized protein n=1 Tax=Jaapia argillacea MUCL 33604 TaxID=933084 RepID=A0A067PHF9_9AGAM|nr:hypothetical protein JAAARDRAFT_49294 [Jaapia argillacea MUCL 33604]
MSFLDGFMGFKWVLNPFRRPNLLLDQEQDHVFGLVIYWNCGLDIWSCLGSEHVQSGSELNHGNTITTWHAGPSIPGRVEIQDGVLIFILKIGPSYVRTLMSLEFPQVKQFPYFIPVSTKLNHIVLDLTGSKTPLKFGHVFIIVFRAQGLNSSRY